MRTAILSPSPEYQIYLTDCIRPFKFIELAGCFQTIDELLDQENIRGIDLFIVNFPTHLTWFENLMQANEHHACQFLIIHDGAEKKPMSAAPIIFLSSTFSTLEFIEAVSTLCKHYLQIRSGVTSHSSSIKSVDTDYFFVKNGTRYHKLFFRDILYFEKEGNYFTIYLKDSRKIMSRQNFSSLIQKIPAHQFIRVHISYIVSLRHIDYVNGNVVSISNQLIPISTKYRKDLMDLIDQS